MNGITINDLRVGQSADFSKTILDNDIYTFAGITGDFNPAHVNEEYSKGSQYGGRICHGMLSAGLISTVIGMQLPGPGTVYLGQNLKFVAPVYPGDTITATVSVKSIDKTKNRIVLDTVCTNQKGETVLVGEAKVMPPATSAA